MLVYRTSRRCRKSVPLLRALREETERLEKSPVHSAVRDLLVAFDELESGIADALNPEEDAGGEVEDSFRKAALDLGRTFVSSFDGRGEETRAGVRRLAGRLAELERLDLPPEISAAVAEGYAWYALYPETYVAAARRFGRELRPVRAVCLGIRQIGGSLSAVVAAALAEEGCPVSLHTVRPRGHPFARTFLPSPGLAERLRCEGEAAHFLLVDEGPGLSGSSFCSVAENLSRWGIPDERIVFFPSWSPDAGAFVSRSARERWPRHRFFVAGWQQSWPGASPLAAAFPGLEHRDFSGGLWRPPVMEDAARFPPVHPHHERRKFLLASPPSSPGSASSLMARFAGFGERGKSVLARAQALETAGWGPPVIGLTEGFLVTRFVRGRPLLPRDDPPGFAETLASYLAWVRSRFPTQEGTEPETLMEMVRINVAEELGWELPPLDRLYVPAPSTVLDARLFPHEWLSTPGGYRKMDGTDHGDDHFFPGPTDIAWDLAGACIEFRLPSDGVSRLLGRYADLTGDREVRRRLPFHRLAYLAFRLGYARLCARTLEGSDDGGRFDRAAGRYRRLLRAALRSDLSGTLSCML